jgi:hypothetical protein
MTRLKATFDMEDVVQRSPTTTTSLPVHIFMHSAASLNLAASSQNRRTEHDSCRVNTIYKYTFTKALAFLLYRRNISQWYVLSNSC